MIVLVVLAIVVASVPLAGGKLSRLSTVQIEETWLIMLGFAVQTVVISVAPRELAPIADAVHLASYLLAGAFVVMNLHVNGLWLVGLGGGLNFAAIMANGGTMPAGEWATRVAGMVLEEGEFANSDVVTNPKLLVLGDIFPVPSSWPLSNVFSIGDVLLVVGAAAVMHGLCESWFSAPRRAERSAARAEAAAVRAALAAPRSPSAPIGATTEASTEAIAGSTTEIADVAAGADDAEVVLVGPAQRH